MKEMKEFQSWNSGYYIIVETSFGLVSVHQKNKLFDINSAILESDSGAVGKEVIMKKKNFWWSCLLILQ
jgi:hypothetical protein